MPPGLYDLFRQRGSLLGDDLRDGFAAEDEIIWKPAVEVRRKNDQFVVTAALAGVDAKDLDVKVTPEALLITAETHHEHDQAQGEVHVCEFRSGKLFRRVSFPEKIDPDKVTAEYRDGILHLQATIAGNERSRKVPIAGA